MEEEDYDLYVGEILRKKEGMQRQGHSYKRRVDRHQKHSVIYRSINHVNSNNDKIREIAVTEVDEFFDYGFWKANDSISYFRSSQQRERTFNTPELWESLETFLEEKALRITKEFSRYKGVCEIHYDLPVTGHVLCPNQLIINKKLKVQASWLYWNGKYYNPDFIYHYVGQAKKGYRDGETYQAWDNSQGYVQEGHLEKICPLVHGKDLQMTLGRINQRLNRIAASVFNNRKNQESLEIDLGRVCELTHIGSLGGYPKKTCLFPRIDLIDPYYRSRKKIMRRNSPYVYVIHSDAELCWVTRYRLEFRDIVTGKWRPYDSTFVGNKDICTENIHKISLIARYVRVIPLDYHNGKAMRVLLYGEGFRSKIEEADLEVDTIRYTISPPARSITFDGYGLYRDYYGIECKNRLKRKLVEDEIQNYRDS